MTPADFRRIALSLPGVEEYPHAGLPAFRIGGRKFASLASQADGYGNLALTLEQQEAFVKEAPEIFLPIPGGWGRMGHTHIRLAAANEDVLAGALRTAWKLRFEKNKKRGLSRRGVAGRSIGKKVTAQGRFRSLKKHEQAAIEAVARRFSATSQEGGGPSGASLMVAGKRVAVDLTTLKRRGSGEPDAPKLRLRFDKVVTRLMERLQATLCDAVPERTTVLVTVTAPIRLASKTAVALQDRIQALLRQGSPRRDAKETIHGNGVRIRVLRHKSERAPKLIGFVHNAGTDPLLLLDITREALEFIGAQAGTKKTRLDRWLVVVNQKRASCLEAYRYVYSQLGMATDFSRILIVCGDGRVEQLAG